MGAVRTAINRGLLTALVLGALLVTAFYLVQLRDSSRSGGQGPPALSELSQNSQAKKGKITICHRTASDNNPYVRIRVSKNAVRAHRRHPAKNGRRDIIPAPGSGCPGPYGSNS